MIYYIELIEDVHDPWREMMLLKILITQNVWQTENDCILVTKIRGDHKTPSRKTTGSC
jgi:hypothetical protein